MSDTWRDNIIPINTNVVAAINNRSLGLKGWNSRQGPLYQYADRTIVSQTLENEKFQLPPRTRTTFITAFSPKNRLLASCHGDHNTHILDVKTKKHIKSLSGHERSPWCVAFHPGIQDILATGSLNGEVRVWDLRADASESYTVDQEENVAIASLSFHPYDHVLAIAAGNEIHFWDWSLPRPFASVKTNNPEIEKVRLVRFDPWGHSIITGVGNPEDEEEDEPTFDHWSWLFASSSRSRRPGSGESRASTRRRMSRRFVPEPDNPPVERTRGLDNPRQPEHSGPRRSSPRWSRRPRLSPPEDRGQLMDQSLDNSDSDGWMRSELRPRSNLSETHQRILHARVSVNAEIRQQRTRLQMLRQERQRLEMRLRELQNSANEVRNSTPMLLLTPSTGSNDPTEINLDQPPLIGAPYERSIDSSVRERERLLNNLTNENENNRRSTSDPMAMDTRTYTELSTIRPSDYHPGLRPNFPLRGRHLYPVRSMESYSQPRIAPYVSFPRSFEAYGSTSLENPTPSLSERRERITERFRRLRQNFLRNFNPRSSPTLGLQSDSNTHATAMTRTSTSIARVADGVTPSSILANPVASSTAPSSIARASGGSNSRVISVSDILLAQSTRRGEQTGESLRDGQLGANAQPLTLLERSLGSQQTQGDETPSSSFGSSSWHYNTTNDSIAVAQTSTNSNDAIIPLADPRASSANNTVNPLLSLAISAQRVERSDVSQPNRDEIMEIDIPDVQSSITLETTGSNERYIDFASSVRHTNLEEQFTHTSNSITQIPNSQDRHLLQLVSTSSNPLRAIPTNCVRAGTVTTNISQLGPDTTSEHESLRMLSRANLIRRVEPRPNQFGLASSSGNPPSLDEWLSSRSPNDELFHIPSPPTPPILLEPPQYPSLMLNTQSSTFQSSEHNFAASFSTPSSLITSAPLSVTNLVSSSQSGSGHMLTSLSSSTERRLENVRRLQSPTSILMAAMDESESTSSRSSTRNPSPVAMEENTQQLGLGSSTEVTQSSVDSSYPSQPVGDDNLPLSTAQSLSEAVDSLIQATDSLTEAADTLLREATTSASNLIAEEFSQSPDGSPVSPAVEDATTTRTISSTNSTTSQTTSNIAPAYSPYIGRYSAGNDDYTNLLAGLDSSRTLGVFHYGRNYTPNRFEPRSSVPTELTGTTMLSRSTSTSSRLIRPSDMSWRSIPPRRRGLHHRELRSWLTSRSRGTTRRRDTDSDSDDENPPRPRLDVGSYTRSRDTIGSTSANPPIHRGQRTRNEPSSSTGVRSNPRSRTHRQLRRTRNIMRTSINRIISTVYAENNGHQAVVLNIDSATYRLQHWDFTRLKLPEISRSDVNVLVPHCKIYNDASVDISRDGRLLAALVPTFVGFPDNMMNVAVFSLQPKNFGQLLFKKAYGPNAVCLSISPLCNHICVGLKSRQFLLGESRPNRFLMAQVLEMAKDQYCCTEMPVVRHICHPAREQQNRLVSINTIAWSPEVGGGLVYGTNNGDVRMCSISSKDRDSDDSDDNDMAS